jgi:acyl-homoserine-lactone acylase
MRSEKVDGGVRKAEQGESYILLVRYCKDGPVMESINVYGASNQPDSPHYADQMELFLNQQLKPMSLNKNEILKNARKVYQPGVSQ